jgi:CDP-glycerol glycerophosphotransferase (TagB/SpsB family)
VDVLVTDYSSIAYDYRATGGKNVIHTTSDLAEFEDHCGRSPLPHEKQFPGEKFNIKHEFFDFFEGITDFDRDVIDIKEYSNL